MAWEAFDTLRKEQEVITAVPLDYICKFCSGTKVFDGYDEFGMKIDLPTCTSCGAVDNEYISDEPEWRSGAEEGPDPSRVGCPMNLDHFSTNWNMGTLIKGGNHNFRTKRLMVRQVHCNVFHKDRSLYHAYKEMDEIGKGTLSLPDAVMYDAKTKYKKFNENVLTRGAVRNGIKANCIFRACRDANVARTTQEIAEAFGIPARDVSRTADMFRETIPEKSAGVTKPSDLIARLFNEVKCVPDEQRGRVRQKVIQSCRVYESDMKLMGKTPKGVASAVMFVTLAQMGFEVNKDEICAICDVSLPTLNKLEKLLAS